MSGPAISALFVAAMWLVAVVLIMIFPAACERAWLIVANIVTFGWYRRHGERAQVERWKTAWLQAQGRPAVWLPHSEPPQTAPGDTRKVITLDTIARDMTALHARASSNSRPSRAPRSPFPTTPEGWSILLGNTNRVTGFFSREAVDSGLCKQFMQAYADHYIQDAPRCPHRNAVPVEDLAGETVAALCPDCDQQLPADWVTP